MYSIAKPGSIVTLFIKTRILFLTNSAAGDLFPCISCRLGMKIIHTAMNYDRLSNDLLHRKPGCGNGEIRRVAACKQWWEISCVKRMRNAIRIIVSSRTGKHVSVTLTVFMDMKSVKPAQIRCRKPRYAYNYKNPSLLLVKLRFSA